MKHLTYLVYILVWESAVIGGCAYMVFWRDASAWWFLFAIYLSMAAYSPSKWGLTE